MPAYSGQKTVTAAGTAVQLGSARVDGALMVKALDTNSGVIAIGNDGAGNVTVLNGLRLLKGESVIFEYVGSLADLWLNSSANGDGVAWLVLNL